MDKYDIDEFLILSNARMKKLRSEYGYTYKQLSQLTGISSSTLQRYEKNPHSSIPLTKLEAIANAYNVSTSYLMGAESRYISHKELEGLEMLLNDIGYDLKYDGRTELFILSNDSFSWNMYADQLKRLKSEILSFLKFKLIDELNQSQ